MATIACNTCVVAFFLERPSDISVETVSALTVLAAAEDATGDLPRARHQPVEVSLQLDASDSGLESRIQGCMQGWEGACQWFGAS